MKFTCPTCGKALAVPDDSSGKKAKCPSCQERITVPPASGLAPPRPQAPAVVKPIPRKEADRDKIAARAIPPRHADTDEADVAAEDRPRRRSRQRDDDEGAIFVYIAGDDVEFEKGLRNVLRDYIRTEMLEIPLAEWDERPPDEPGPNDVVIHGAITDADYGSQLIRYFVPILPLFGFGACRLAIDLDIEDGTGQRQRVQSKAVQTFGAFGGSNNAMMNTNIRILSHRTARAMTGVLKGPGMLNRQAYGCALASLILGFFSVIPFLGVLLGALGMILGLIAFATISKRRLPRRKVLAIAGIVVSLFGALLSALFSVLIVMQK